MDLAAERARRWWQTRQPVRSIRRAAAFIEDVGFALLFPARGIELPSLYNAASERLAGSLGSLEWGPDSERVWHWKDELPRLGLAWYGKFVTGRASLLSPRLLADLYPRSGAPDDFTEAPLSTEARRIAEIILLSGPTSTAVLREELGLEGRRGRARFSQVLTELGRALVVTNFGTEEQGSGWPAAVLELTARGFALPNRRRMDGRLFASRTFLETVVAARPEELARAFGWPTAQARALLQELASRGEAAWHGDTYRRERRNRPRTSRSSKEDRQRRALLPKAGPSHAIEV